jgi:hypothetical protein
MKKSIIVILSQLLITFASTGETLEQVGDWSETIDYLKARLILGHRITPEFEGRETLAYLELCNTCPPQGTIIRKIAFSPINGMSFCIKDANGTPIEPKPVFCSTVMSTKALDLVVPQDGTLRFCISMNGGSVSSNKTLLYLKPGEGWCFPHSSNEVFTLSARLTVKREMDGKFDAACWHGSLELPAVRIPIPSE